MEWDQRLLPRAYQEGAVVYVAPRLGSQRGRWRRILRFDEGDDAQVLLRMASMDTIRVIPMPVPQGIKVKAKGSWLYE